MSIAYRQFSQIRRLRLLSDGFDSNSTKDTKAARSVDDLSLVIAWRSLVQRTGLTQLAARRLEIANSACCLLSILASYTSGLPLILALPLATMLATYLYCRGKASGRSRAFDRDYPTFLTTLSSTVRTGMDPRIAFGEAIKLFPPNSPIYEETKLTVDAWNSGLDDEAAIARFASSVSHPDVALLRAATTLALAHGTAFSECLHRLARVTRARQSFRRKVRAALAMQRLSAIGIGLSASCIAALQVVTNRAGLAATWDSSSGRIFLSLGIALVILGIIWMTRIGLRAE